MDPLSRRRSIFGNISKAPRLRAFKPDYVLAAVLIWSMILYGLLAPRAPPTGRLATRSIPVCVR